MKTKKNDWN